MGQVIFLNSHPIQYFAPLYKAIEKNQLFSVTVLYCSKQGLDGQRDREFNADIKWDIPVLDGYRAVFLKNHAPAPTIYHPLGLINLGIFPFLFKSQKSILIVHGWGYITHLLTLIAGRIFGHVVCLRGENPASHEGAQGRFKRWLKRVFISRFISPLCHYVFFIGKENKRYFLEYGVRESKLIFAPYSVDNQRFQQAASVFKPQKKSLRVALGLPPEKVIFLFSGKYISKKRPLDLLRAFQQCEYRERACLVLMGDGALRQDMQKFIDESNLRNVVLTGFINQSKVVEYYAAADVFVMCSQEGETWGLSANEAMNFSLPLLLSDLTGSSGDLVDQGINGWVFKTGDTKTLAEKMDTLISMPANQLTAMGSASLKKVQQYSYDQVIEALETVHKKAFV